MRDFIYFHAFQYTYCEIFINISYFCYSYARLSFYPAGAKKCNRECIGSITLG